MRTWGYVAGIGVVAAGAAAYLFLAHKPPEGALQDRWVMLNKYCSDCHNDSDLTADLSVMAILSLARHSQAPTPRDRRRGDRCDDCSETVASSASRVQSRVCPPPKTLRNGPMYL